MRRLFGRATAAVLMLASAPSVFAQDGEGVTPAPAAPNIVLPRPVAVPDDPGFGPVIMPAYAPYMLSPSPSHPWVMVPSSPIAKSFDSGLAYGYRTSPYGDYSRFTYFKTSSPFPGRRRAWVHFENDHKHGY